MNTLSLSSPTSPRRGTYALLVGLACLLVGAAVINWQGARRREAPRPRRVVPAQEARLEGIFGSNPYAVRSEVVDTSLVLPIILANDVCNRRFSDGRVEFELYVAHWRPGEVGLDNATGHVPDTCWTLAGWKCQAGETRRGLQVNGVTLPPAEWRRFSHPGETQEVWYWCLTGESLYPFRYDPVAIERWEGDRDGRRQRQERPFVLREFLGESDFLRYWRRWWQGESTEAERSVGIIPRDTYFVRINSRFGFSVLQVNPMFRETVSRLPQIGLGKRVERAVP